MFQSWELPRYVSTDIAAPESPLFCPGDDFATLNTDHQISAQTLELLSDMRHLTKMYIARQDYTDVAYEREVTRIRRAIASHPPPSSRSPLSTTDWIFETCRIAAMIYTAAIILRLPFSLAAGHVLNAEVFRDASFGTTDSPEKYSGKHLSERLFSALRQTDVVSMWGNMSGVFYWVCALGAAAARATVVVDTTKSNRSKEEEKRLWVRRCFVMHATRAMIVLILQHPIPVLTAQQTLLKVQELVGNRKQDLAWR